MIGASPIPIERLAVSAYTIPTDGPEADGIAQWDSTTMVVVEATAAGRCGLGFTYASAASARIVDDPLAEAVAGGDAMDVPGAWAAMARSIRNHGRPGGYSMAIAAVDAALWDLEAKLFDVALVALLGAIRDAVPIYGSGGFTTYSRERLQAQLGGWAAEGIRCGAGLRQRPPGPGEVPESRHQHTASVSAR